jgi:hypothetical protein
VLTFGYITVNKNKKEIYTMYQLKSAARRVGLLIPAISLLAAISYQAVAPSMTFADALNPLTKRTLLLTSSSPGWAYTDGSGDSTYAPAGSGPNGKETGETYTFNTSTNSTGGGTATVKAFTLQYCTTAAGDCLSPGDDMNEPAPGGAGTGCTLGTSTAGGNYVCPNGSKPYYTDDASHTDISVVGSWGEGGTVVSNVPTTTAGDFQIYENTAGTWSATSGWTMTVSNLEDATDIVSGSAITGQTGAKNYITLTNTTGITPAADQELMVQFQPSSTAYITNPGQSSFFVKLNDYNSATYQDFRDNYPTNSQLQDTLDGGVTVAQVMNQSIEIQTKVLETMDFSVGTVDPDTLTNAELSSDTSGLEATHGQCDPILPDDSNNLANTPANPSPDTLLMGDQDAEYSLSPTVPYDATSMFRVATNAANGATVYYSGSTLHDTEGNAIQGMSDNPTSNVSAFADAGTEQFGLGLEFKDIANSTYYDTNNAGTDLQTNETLDSGFTTAATTNGLPYWYVPTLSPLLPSPSYGGASDLGADGTLASGSGPKFAFNASANTTPVPIATEDTQVVNCSTGMVRYVADIAPSTPAGIYTTAINYLAAPEY